MDDKPIEQAGTAIWQGGRGAAIAAGMLLVAGWGIVEVAGMVGSSRAELRREIRQETAAEYKELLRDANQELARARCLNLVLVTALLHSVKPSKEELQSCEALKSGAGLPF